MDGICFGCPETLTTTRTSGMGCCFLIIFKSITASLWECVSANGSFTNLASPCKGHADRPMRLIPSSRKPLKKILPVDEGSPYATLVRRRSTFSTTYQLDSHVGSPGTAALHPFRFYAREGEYLGGSRLENRTPSYPSSHYLQRPDLWPFSVVSSPTYRWEDSPHFRQRHLAPSKRTERFLSHSWGTTCASFPSPLLSRTESDRAGLAHHPPTNHPQPLPRITCRARNSPECPFCEMGVPQ
ncbi:hypothetical protein HKBW3S33_01856 [Candidatus Hakubella thermalkaliphila]|uniref:Uncharacterized protein n=1 Tax=Candidatus Hakubella thermalkaliphila TaxID=2754717 RepID=A0A6V8PC18_9ACTN|nr:hypothetical protein HKBW3S33_01856 [Candidatus Hakubella thermalkaliphila]